MVEVNVVTLLGALVALDILSIGVGIVNARRLSDASKAVNMAERAHAKAERVESELGIRGD